MQRIEQGVSPDQLQHAIGAARNGRAHLARYRAVVDEDVIGAALAQQCLSLGAARRGEDRRAVSSCEHRRGQSDRGRSATDKERLPGFDFERGMERSPRRLDHLGQGAERCPVERGVQRLHLSCGNGGELGVTAVEAPAHAPHRRGHDLAASKLAAGRLLDDAHGFDAEDARELNVR